MLKIEKERERERETNVINVDFDLNHFWVIAVVKVIKLHKQSEERESERN